MTQQFKLTYSTMFSPPEALHTRFEDALVSVKSQLGQTHPHYINGENVVAGRTREKRSPIDQDLVLGRFADGTPEETEMAIDAARKAFPTWRNMQYSERNRILRKAASLIEERVYEISAAVALEVGKNRMEALGEVQETADFFNVYCDDFEKNKGFDHALPDDPLEGFKSTNRSVMKPLGVWAVIAPFNFPFALAGGPVAAALVTGNTVVLKGATDTPWSGRMLADCLHDAGIPPGVFNFVNGTARDVGEVLVEHPRVAGITFTGSYRAGMHIYRSLAAGPYPRPCIIEMGGKNATIVTRSADLDRAAVGIVRSAFGLSGQKCSALSRLYVDESVADELVVKLQQEIGKIRLGDPTQRVNWLGPVANLAAYENFADYCEQLRTAGARILSGGEQTRDGALARGFYCQPTLAELPLDHVLWKEEMFVPILTLARVPDRETAMELTNDVDQGLTAGIYGSEDDVRWFLDGVEAGVTYANRPQGATTGAWPGYQPFGGWKGSGSTGKAIASFYYLPLYLREQSQTVVE
ncbi:MAG: aldehyde dehydrogenase family protein [Gammaproteobacteria bacterium]|nr:aldehyde dehydrogenase family protein [Gammaproteobacteria bacterium]